MAPRGSQKFAAASDDPRTCFIQNDESNIKFKFCDNSISTSKYNLISFLPLSLMQQFRRIANIYFLVVSVLMMLGSYTSLFESPLSPFSTFGTLVIVMLMTSAKEGLEDLKRHKSDYEVNNAKATVISADGKEVLTKWRDVKVGSIIVVRDRELLPVDCVLLKSSNEGGITYIETSNLDGETNLKLRQVATSLLDLPVDVHKVTGRLASEMPNRRIHNFEGTLYLDCLEKPVSLDASNFLLRGCQLRNTKSVYGVVVFTGSDTKIMQNSRGTRSKMSNIERTVNRSIKYVFLTQALLVTMSTVADLAQNLEDHWYIMGESSAQIPAPIAAWFIFLILYNNFVPISLYVTMEMVNYIHSMFIDQDEQMYCPESQTYARCRTSNLCQELGQIEYVFSDKTGTLTRNVMEFRRCSINSVVYGQPMGNGGDASNSPDSEKGNDGIELQKKLPVKSSFTDGSLLENLQAAGPHSFWIHEFILNLAVCHTVVAEVSEKDPKEIIYQAESPDEGALVKAAKELGYEFITRTTKGVVVKIAGQKEQEYQILATNQFNSTRKRMSVLVRRPDGQYLLYCKGADNIMLARSDRQEDRATLDKHLAMFANEGLRTLVLSVRELSSNDALAWLKKYEEALCAMKDRDEQMMQVAEEIEKNMKIVGATAIEDRLQDGVPQTIADLGRAGVKLWVLTGDKQETAINIGYSCKLLLPDSKLIKVLDEHRDKLQAQVTKLLNHFGKLNKSTSRLAFLNNILPLGKNQANPNSSDYSDESEELQLFETDHLALIVDGAALAIIFDDQDLKNNFLKLACICKVVIACRVSPAQKALIVRLVKKGLNPSPMTLAIGDGANDVGMIQEAHVGVGISGKEGMQAVNSSDFAIAQFRFLKRLLLVHGRWNYKRMSKVVLYSFYKNIVITLTLFYYSGFTAFSGTALYESLVYAGFNFFLGLPIMGVGMFDQDVSGRTAEKFPQMYRSGKSKKYLNTGKMIEAIVIALLHSFIITFFPMWAIDSSIDLMVLGLFIYSMLVVSMTAKCGFETLTFTWISWVFLLGSVGFYFFFCLAYNAMLVVTPEFYFVAMETFKIARFWLLIFTLPYICLIVDVCARYIRILYFPTANKISMEIDRGYGERASDLEETRQDVERGDSAKDSAMELLANHSVTSDSQRRSFVHLADIKKLVSELPQEEREAMGIDEGNDRGFAFSHCTTTTGYARYSSILDATLDANDSVQDDPDNDGPN
eukprot:TRINITY_DN2907_c2_g4::TRINITY_DN2907_c2_g4_i1::g.4143::m.4143 TRINITY_DN2907_c2_g4::TRINITY_DN2907_c2_g4_i1::g.4143  ORF type:complete len:1247 (+),score=388.28,sp/P98200/AT8A2_MOUSE/42.59/0.0,E1-E2_ATPase/PF00122.15/4.7e-16,Hydrolase_like2/PF13246.1/1.9e-13,Hydrolase_like2/PF13246.1/1.5e+04,Hydrolase/PF00702.21/2.8e-06,Hydrolase/PF00702.21/0.00042,HAD/PF12710.2/9.5e+03,HAD/PF12710.2/1.4e-11,Hydrolase_3/PF08282.7/2.8e+03,Hydrolase_3/PF08282.7/0.011 TRINITY_DN2907_c2_g4_i1:61-3741(+)